MFWFLKNDILKILDSTQKEREALQNHSIYRSIKTMDQLHIFMESHIFAVWDFMSIPKSLKESSFEKIVNNSFLAFIHASSKSLKFLGKAKSGTFP